MSAAAPAADLPARRAAPRRRARGLFALLAGLLLLAVTLLALAQFFLLPPAQPLTASPAVFSGQRAWADLYTLAIQPRVPGGEWHAQVAGALERRLQGLGFTVERQVFRLPDVEPQFTNLVARLPGSDPNGRAIALVAHYDSIAGSPGAGDNASGVAVVMEIARALAASGQPLTHDLLVILTDGEELGIYGAAGYVAGHPSADEVALALNVDGLSQGPVMIWRSAPGNGWLVEQYARSAAFPAGYAWIDALARVLPLDTDLTPFRVVGIAGANFTSPYLPPGFHSPADTAAAVSPATLQHAGDSLLALVRAADAAGLTVTHAPDQVYFNLWGRWFVHFPAALAPLLAVLVTLLLLAVLGAGFGAARLTLRGVGRGLLLALVQVTALPVLAGAAWFGMLFLPEAFTPRGLTLRLAAVAVVPLLIFALGYRTGRRAANPDDLLAGALLVTTGLLVWAALAAPMAVAQPALLALLAGLGLAARLTSWRIARTVGLLTGALSLLVWVPMLAVLYAISSRMFAPAAVAAGVLALALGLLLPQIAPLAQPKPAE
jgi:hypothetical protein